MLRDGRQDSSSLLVVGDAIFVVPNVGRMPEVCVSCFGNISRQFVGDDSINQAKIDEEFEWGNTHTSIWDLE